MKKENIFYLLFILTVVAIRLWVFVFPARKLIINGTLIHHFWIGMLLILFVFILSARYTIARLVLLASGVGLLADELIYIIGGGKTVKDYWSLYSVSGALVMILAVFIFKNKLTRRV